MGIKKAEADFEIELLRTKERASFTPVDSKQKMNDMAGNNAAKENRHRHQKPQGHQQGQRPTWKKGAAKKDSKNEVMSDPSMR